MQPEDILFELRRRGVAVNPGLPASEINRLSELYGRELASYLQKIYKVFDGFQIGHIDPGSCINVWPLETVLQESNPENKRISFADFLMNSNEYTLCINDASQPVMMDGEVVAANVQQFWDLLISGKYDF